MEYRKLAHIQDSHGLKGELKIVVLSNDDSFLEEGKTVYLLHGEEYVPFTVEEYRVYPKATVLKLNGIDSISEAEKFLKEDLYAIKEELEGKIYLEDLIGLKVLSKARKELGSVADYYVAGSKSYLLIGKNLVPYIPGVMVERIDFDQKEIVLTELGEEVLLHA